MTRTVKMLATGGRKLPVNLPGLAIVAAFLVAWELYTRTLGAEFDSLASVGEIVVALKALWTEGPLLGQILHTLTVAVAGWLAAGVIGLTLGAIIGASRPVWTYTMASIDVLRSIPSISLVSVALLVFGFSFRSELVIVIYVSQWPVLLATMGGLRSTPEGLLEMARSLRLTPAATVLKILLPAAVPSILVGLRLALTLSIALTVVAEMIGNPAGLGFGLVYAQRAIQPAEAFAYLVVIGILGWLANAVFLQIVRRGFAGYGVVS
ncbi:ABC-type nitrate/sulfonate/bicarbonate transport system permease component [Amorphus suaedae]